MKGWKPILPPLRKFKIKVFEGAAKTGQFIYQIGESDDLRKPSKGNPKEFILESDPNFYKNAKFEKV